MRFFDTFAMQGKDLALRSVRSPDFFRFLNLHSDRWATLLVDFGDELPTAVATLSFRPGYIDGKPVDVCYLGDLRARFDRETSVRWRQIYTAFLKGLPTPFITCIIDENSQAQNTLTKKSKHYVYERLTGYSMVNLIARFPWARFARRNSPYSTACACSEDLAELRDFLDRENRARAFGHRFADGELDRRLRVWPGLELRSFLLARSRNDGRIVGCFAPWSPSSAKVNVVERIPRSLNLLRPFVTVPKPGQPLKTTYFTHLEVAGALSREGRREIFRALVDHYFEHSRWPGEHAAAFCDFDANGFADALPAYLKHSVPMALYAVRHPDKPPGCGPEATWREPGFEMALV